MSARTALGRNLPLDFLLSLLVKMLPRKPNTDVKVQLQPTHGCEVLIVLRRLQLTASTFCSVYVFCPVSVCPKLTFTNYSLACRKQTLLAQLISAAS